MPRELKRYRVVVESAIAEGEGDGKSIFSLDGPGVRGITKQGEARIARFIERVLNAALDLDNLDGEKG